MRSIELDQLRYLSNCFIAAQIWVNIVYYIYAEKNNQLYKIFSNERSHMIKTNSCGIKLFSKFADYCDNQTAIILVKNQKSWKSLNI